MSGSWDASVFDGIYARGADPWDVETSAYEREKYDATLAALPAPRYRRALEIGCSIGAQTVRLATRCDSLLALDFAAEAVRRTRERCAALPHVAVRQARVPVDWPAGLFDLIVISEVLYFLSPQDLANTARLTAGSLAAGGAVLLVNWTGYTDTPTTGDQAADLFMDGVRGWRHAGTRHARYRIDVLTNGPRSS